MPLQTALKGYTQQLPIL